MSKDLNDIFKIQFEGEYLLRMNTPAEQKLYPFQAQFISPIEFEKEKEIHCNVICTDDLSEWIAGCTIKYDNKFDQFEINFYGDFPPERESMGIIFHGYIFASDDEIKMSGGCVHTRMSKEDLPGAWYLREPTAVSKTGKKFLEDITSMN